MRTSEHHAKAVGDLAADIAAARAECGTLDELQTRLAWTVQALKNLAADMDGQRYQAGRA